MSRTEGFRQFEVIRIKPLPPKTVSCFRRFSSEAPLQVPVNLRQPCVYVVASRYHGTLYIGVTSNLPRRIWSHKQGLLPGFTEKYQVNRLVWYELHERMESAIAREKAMKEWKRSWKIQLIEQENPEWRDLYPHLLTQVH